MNTNCNDTVSYLHTLIEVRDVALLRARLIGKEIEQEMDRILDMPLVRINNDVVDGYNQRTDILSDAFNHEISTANKAFDILEKAAKVYPNAGIGNLETDLTSVNVLARTLSHKQDEVGLRIDIVKFAMSEK